MEWRNHLFRLFQGFRILVEFKSVIFKAFHRSKISSLESYTESSGDLESQGLWGTKLDMVQTHHKTQSHTHPFTHYASLEMQISLSVSLDWGGKPVYPKETPKAQGECVCNLKSY